MWLEVLAEECRRSSQADVARELGVSAAVINQTLQGKYRGDIERVRALVEGAYMGRTVDCPVLGEMPLNDCLTHQSRPFAATNHVRVLLWRACRTCPHRRGKEERGRRKES